MSRVSVLVPWRPGEPRRAAAWRHVRGLWQRHHPTWQIVQGRAPAGPWCKAAAVADAAARARGHLLVVADADVWCDGVAQAVDAVAAGAAWAVPHHLVHRLTETATGQILAGAPLEGAPGEPRGRRLAQAPYAGVPGGGLVVLRRRTWQNVPMDPRFRGWGGEDHAWGYALTTLYGLPWRGIAPLWHLWHPPQPRMTRQVGSLESEHLRHRYAAARLDLAVMRALIDEARQEQGWQHDGAGRSAWTTEPSARS